MERFLVAGLGNPGPAYAATRHNAGFRVVDEVCRILRCRLHDGPGPARIGRQVRENVELVLLQPLTYMNASGTAVAVWLEREGIPLTHMLAVVDDLALPLGRLRLRPRGSDGGHNGLRSLMDVLGTEEFPRLRCGIRPDSPPPAEELADFVLSPFQQSERDLVDTMIQRAAEAALVCAAQGVAAAMNRFN